MTELIFTTAITEFTKEFSKQSQGVLKDLKNEIKHFLNDGVEQYLERQVSKYLFIKTLLHRSSPVFFYDIYQPARVDFNRKGFVINTTKDLFNKGKFITVIGDAGSGKSTLIRHLFLRSLLEKEYIPIIIELRYLNDYKGTIEDYIREKIFENKLANDNRILNRLLELGKFTFFLDGYDEIKSNVKNQVIEKFTSIIERFPKNNFVLTSRPYSGIELLQSFHNANIMDLNKEERTAFIRKQKIDPELAKKIIQSITSSNIASIESYLSNPLLLSLYILTFSSNSSVPNKKYIFYRRVFDVLFKEHDSISKIGFERDLQTKLNQEEIEEVLKMFSFLSYFEGIHDFEKDYLNKKFKLIKEKTAFSFSNAKLIEDFKSGLALWIEDGVFHAFAHRSMQEYFAALYVQFLNEKGKAYEKIQNKLLTDTSREISNFLSLCEEMDTYHYRKYLLLPELKIIRTKIDESNDIEMLRTSILFFASSLAVEMDGEKEVDGTAMLEYGDENMRHVFAVKSFQDQMFSLIFEAKEKLLPFMKIRDTSNYKIEMFVNKLVYGIDFLELTDEMLSVLMESELFVYVNTFNKYINDTIAELETFLFKSEKSEKDLIDLL